MSTANAEAEPTANRSTLPRLTAGRFGAALLLLIALPCFLSLPWTLGSPPNTEMGVRYNDLRLEESAQKQSPGSITYTRTTDPVTKGGEPVVTEYKAFEPMGTDQQAWMPYLRATSCMLAQRGSTAVSHTYTGSPK